jgi:hypothetical protein
MARFVELGQALHGRDPRWAPVVLAWERYRLDPRRNPYFEAGDGACFVAHRLGRPVGRIAAHLPAPGAPGRFGFWSVVDEPAAADGLLDTARAWLVGRGCTSMEGPISFTDDDDLGVLAEGFDAPGLTGRPWAPPWESALLVAHGLTAERQVARWRLPAVEGGAPSPPVADPPGHAGRHGDPRLVLPGIAAVPDLSDALRTATLRGAWSLARRVRAGRWDTATVVRCTDPPTEAVPALLTAARRAGYAAVVAPWAPDAAGPPETVHRTYRASW